MGWMGCVILFVIVMVASYRRKAAGSRSVIVVSVMVPPSAG